MIDARRIFVLCQDFDEWLAYLYMVRASGGSHTLLPAYNGTPLKNFQPVGAFPCWYGPDLLYREEPPRYITIWSGPNVAWIKPYQDRDVCHFNGSIFVEMKRKLDNA